MKLTNKLGLPQPIVDAVAADDYSRGASDISVTQLLSPPRMSALIGAHYDELEEDVSDRIWSLLGRGIHVALERAEKVAIPEQRLFMRVGDFVISGAMDRIEVIRADGGSGSKIQDYKTAFVKEMVYGVKVEREQQLNIYRVLLAVNGYPVEELEAIFFLRDWSKVQAFDANKAPRLGDGPVSYPQVPVVVHKVALWDINDAYAFIAGRVAVHMAARDAYAAAIGTDPLSATTQSVLPECDDEERWVHAPSFAVMKAGGKKASTVVETEAEAVAYIEAHPKDKYSVQTRPGRSIRCQFYCSAAQVCDQWKGMQVV